VPDGAQPGGVEVAGPGSAHPTLIELRDRLRTVLAGWEQVLGQGQPRCRAGLLESLAAAQPPESKPLPPYLYAAVYKERSR
jgi:hypothetical protein